MDNIMQKNFIFQLLGEQYKFQTHQHPMDNNLTNSFQKGPTSINEDQRLNKIKKFLVKHEKDLSKQIKKLENPIQHIKLNVLSSEEIQMAAEQIQLNRLVAFPTETVFGLGANALCEEALLEIYKVKKRPLTDPIIVHVLNLEQTQELVQLTQRQRQIAKILTDKYWPGPLTIILKANLQVLPAVVTAQTGFVGIRSPKHPYARRLLEQSKRPIGAPSANLFSHVSPTSPVHVFNDFYDQNITLVDGDRCEFGIESTVVKIAEQGERINIMVLREGSLSVRRLEQFMKETYKDKESIPEVSIVGRVKDIGQNMQSPGQLLKHYSPYLPCYFCNEAEQLNEQKCTIKFQKIAMMSFSKSYLPFKNRFKHYFQVDSEIVFQQKHNQQNKQSNTFEQQYNQNIFCPREEQIAMRNLYYMLRHCENLDCEAIVIGWSGAKLGTIWDKIFRATEGKQLSP